MKMKSLILPTVTLLFVGSLKAQTALTIDAGSMASSATLHVIVFANDMASYDMVGKTMPITVSASSGTVTLSDADIQWDGQPPSGDWGWGYAEVRLSCGTPSQSATPNLCGSLNIDGVMVGYINYPHEDCFEADNTSCGATSGDTVVGKMGNSGKEKPSYPALIEIE